MIEKELYPGPLLFLFLSLIETDEVPIHLGKLLRSIHRIDFIFVAFTLFCIYMS
jgi:large-conductance mechanosensitive channel